ncbi:hypothetical protein WR25_04710 [Diploscapter pachys]|uniref:Zinc finger DksA/TraR C4-type domain-containing protein n=1 Tax=Diploscapter pachys TaxID=2018661 RepID=A0A2A2K276_9BILA|nr:hypothetical protein WR25_04710 [Diploscapter pachys]
MRDHALLDLFGVDGAAGTFGDVDGATADQRTATGACAQFRQSHPYGHRAPHQYGGGPGFKFRDRRESGMATHLVSKIEAAIRRIDEGEYGYCEVTGEPISLGRLEARPIATMTLEAQERHERNEKISRED